MLHTLLLDWDPDAEQRAAATLVALAAAPVVPDGVDVNSLPKDEQRDLIREQMRRDRQARAARGR